VGVIEAPRVKLTNGLFRTMEKPTSVPTDHGRYRSHCRPASFIQGGSAALGRWRTNRKIPRDRHVALALLAMTIFIQGGSAAAGRCATRNDNFGRRRFHPGWVGRGPVAN
jgi:hypothetical protein